MSLTPGDDAAWIIQAVLAHVYDPRYSRGEKTCLVAHGADRPPHYTFNFSGSRVTLDCFAQAGTVLYVLKGTGWMLTLDRASMQITRAWGDDEAMNRTLVAMRLMAPTV